MRADSVCLSGAGFWSVIAATWQSNIGSSRWLAGWRPRASATAAIRHVCVKESQLRAQRYPRFSATWQSNLTTPDCRFSRCLSKAPYIPSPQQVVQCRQRRITTNAQTSQANAGLADDRHHGHRCKRGYFGCRGLDRPLAVGRWCFFRTSAPARRWRCSAQRGTASLSQKRSNSACRTRRAAPSLRGHARCGWGRARGDQNRVSTDPFLKNLELRHFVAALLRTVSATPAEVRAARHNARGTSPAAPEPRRARRSAGAARPRSLPRRRATSLRQC
jgi:hypothetical protein